MSETKQPASIIPEKQHDLEHRILEAAKKNRLPCSKALAIARTMKISPAEVGKAADSLNIKISRCQLGCF